MNNYRPIKQKAKEIEAWLTRSSLKNLKTVFSPSFFQIVHGQIRSMEKRQAHGPINSMFIFLLDNSGGDSSQILLFEKYLGLIFSRLTTKKRNKIIGELRGDSSIDTFFEIGILANLLIQIPKGKIELFPKTVGKKNVDARLEPVNRWLYLECTVLHESDSDKERIEKMLIGKNITHYVGAINPQKGERRFQRKLLEKCNQFAPSLPNVILVSTFDSYPLPTTKNQAMQEIKLNNISAVLDFGREKFKKIYKDGCESVIQLTNEEKEILKTLFSTPKYKPLVY
jgi:hypothetical protein